MCSDVPSYPPTPPDRHVLVSRFVCLLLPVLPGHTFQPATRHMRPEHPPSRPPITRAHTARPSERKRESTPERVDDGKVQVSEQLRMNPTARARTPPSLRVKSPCTKFTENEGLLVAFARLTRSARRRGNSSFLRRNLWRVRQPPCRTVHDETAQYLYKPLGG